MKNLITLPIFALLFLSALAVSAQSSAEIVITEMQVEPACDQGGAVSMMLSEIPTLACLTEATTGHHIDLNPSSKKLTIPNLQPGNYTLHLTKGEEYGGARFTIADCTTVSHTGRLQVSVQLQGGILQATVSGGAPGYHYLWTRQGKRVGTMSYLNSPHPGFYEVTVLDEKNTRTRVTYVVSAEPTTLASDGCPDISTTLLRGEHRTFFFTDDGDISIIDHWGKGSSSIVDGELTYQAPKNYAGKERMCVIQYCVTSDTSICKGRIRITIPPEGKKLKE